MQIVLSKKDGITSVTVIPHGEEPTVDEFTDDEGLKAWFLLSDAYDYFQQEQDAASE